MLTTYTWASEESRSPQVLPMLIQQLQTTTGGLSSGVNISSDSPIGKCFNLLIVITILNLCMINYYHKYYDDIIIKLIKK